LVNEELRTSGERCVVTLAGFGTGKSVPGTGEVAACGVVTIQSVRIRPVTESARTLFHANLQGATVKGAASLVNWGQYTPSCQEEKKAVGRAV
jgi:hypothetical protein